MQKFVLKRYKMNKNTLFIFLGIFFFLSSCKTKEKINEYNYLQNVENIATEVSQKTATSTIQKGDQLVILVTAKDMEVVKPFNQNYYSSQNSITPSPSSSMNASERSYLVNSDGNIDFPILGLIETSNKTLEEVKNEMVEKISVYVKNPTVTVRLGNFKVTILGEVARPGQYTLSDVDPTILNALGLAGDLTMFGKRDNVLIVRNVNGETTKERINLMDASFISSPFYKVKQGDVIYVSANQTKEKSARLDPNTNIYIAIAGTVIGLAGIFITIFKK